MIIDSYYLLPYVYSFGTTWCNLNRNVISTAFFGAALLREPHKNVFDLSKTRSGTRLQILAVRNKRACHSRTFSNSSSRC